MRRSRASRTAVFAIVAKQRTAAGRNSATPVFTPMLCIRCGVSVTGARFGSEADGPVPGAASELAMLCGVCAAACTTKEACSGG